MDDKERRAEVLMMVAWSIMTTVYDADAKKPVPPDMLDTANEIWKTASENFFKAVVEKR